MSKRIPIGSKYLEKPIIQGGMGVGVSLGNLAGAVMKEGGMGVISAAHPGYRKENFWKDPLACNIEAVYEEAAKARAISGGRGLLGVNVMVASHHYEDYVKAAIGAGVDVIISGAGMPMNLPSVEGSDQVALAPIVSSGRAARLILKSWDRFCRKPAVLRTPALTITAIWPRPPRRFWKPIVLCKKLWRRRWAGRKPWPDSSGNRLSALTLPATPLTRKSATSYTPMRKPMECEGICGTEKQHMPVNRTDAHGDAEAALCASREWCD